MTTYIRKQLEQQTRGTYWYLFYKGRKASNILAKKKKAHTVVRRREKREPSDPGSELQLGREREREREKEKKKTRT